MPVRYANFIIAYISRIYGMVHLALRPDQRGPLHTADRLRRVKLVPAQDQIGLLGHQIAILRQNGEIPLVKPISRLGGQDAPPELPRLRR
jgi:hypothetical protein